MPGSNWRTPEMVPRRVQLFPTSERRWDVKTLSSAWAQGVLSVQQGCQGCPTRVEHIRRALCNLCGLLSLEEFHILLISRHQDVSPVQFLLMITTTVASTQKTASVLLAAPTTSAAWPSCGEQEGWPLCSQTIGSAEICKCAVAFSSNQKEMGTAQVAEQRCSTRSCSQVQRKIPQCHILLSENKWI